MEERHLEHKICLTLGLALLLSHLNQIYRCIDQGSFVQI